MNRLVAVLLAGLGVLLAPQSSAAQGVYEDGTFDLLDWVEHGAFLFPAGPGGSVASSQMPSDGNPGAHLRFTTEGVSVPLGTASQVWGILINDAAVYDPTVDGAIQSIGFDFDGRRPPGTGGSRVMSLALQQGTYLWAAIPKRVFVGDDNWLPMQITDLTAADFTSHVWTAPGQPANPDFSVTGTPIAFGVTTGTSCPTSVDCSGPPVPTSVDVDNWKVTVDSGPTDPFVVTVIDPNGNTDLQFDYGAYTVGIETRRTFIVRNDGSEVISIQRYDDIDPPFVGPFLATFGAIAPGSSGDFTIGFNPTAVGSFNTSVVLVFAHATTTLELSGQGVSVDARADIVTDILDDPFDGTDPCTLNCALDFEGVVLGNSREGRITVTNGGGATLDVDDVSEVFEATIVSGGVVFDPGTVATGSPFVVDHSCQELYLLAGESCEIDVTFRPEAEVEVVNGLGILFGSDLDSREVENVALIGEGVQSPIEVTDDVGAADDRALDFGRLEPGDMLTGTVTLANVSGQNTTIGALRGMLQAPFILENDGCSSRLLVPGEECSFEVDFTPIASDVGDPPTIFQQRLAIPINSPSPMALDVELTGRLPAYELGVVVQAYDAANENELSRESPVRVGTSFEYEITVRNSGPDKAVGVVVEITLPPVVSIVSEPTDFNDGDWVVGDLEDDQSQTLSVQVEVNEESSLETCIAAVAEITHDLQWDTIPGSNVSISQVNCEAPSGVVQTVEPGGCNCRLGPDSKGVAGNLAMAALLLGWLLVRRRPRS